MNLVSTAPRPSSTHLTLFYPVRSIGGAQLAFARVARQMVMGAGWSVTIVDFMDGFLRRTLTDWGVDFEFRSWTPDGPPVEVGETTLFLSFSGLPHDLKALQATPETRVLLWSLHPHASLAFFRFGFLYNRLPFWLRQFAIRRLEPLTWCSFRDWLADIEGADGLVYMDGPNTRFPFSLGYRRAITHYLPVPIEPGRTAELRWADGISIGWLGRLARDKSHTICAMVELCSRYASANNVAIDFHIVGDGPALVRLQSLAWPGVRLHFPGVLREQQLADYLGANVKVGFAMGTCLLEFSALSIPVLVGDYSNDPIPCERLPLRWFVPNEDYCLGEIVGEHPRRAEVDLAEVARLCGNREAIRALGQRCRDYADANHRIDQVCERLVTQLETTKYRFEEARPVVGWAGRPLGPRLARIFHRMPTREKRQTKSAASTSISTL